MSENPTIENNTGSGTVAAHANAVPLQHVDNLVTHVQANIGDARVTAVAQQLLNYDPEAMVWQDSPGLALMLSSVFKWCVLALIWLAVLAYLAPPGALPNGAASTQASQPEKTDTEKPAGNKKPARKSANATGKANSGAHDANGGNRSAAKKSEAHDDTWYVIVKWIGVLVLAFQLYSHLIWAWRLKCVKYKMSSQRLIIESGIFSKRSNTYELHSLSAGQIESPLLLRMSGRSNLYVGIWLSGIRNAEAVRDLVRNAGQIEASRFEKARWR